MPGRWRAVYKPVYKRRRRRVAKLRPNLPIMNTIPRLPVLPALTLPGNMDVPMVDFDQKYGIPLPLSIPLMNPAGGPILQPAASIAGTLLQGAGQLLGSAVESYIHNRKRQREEPYSLPSPEKMARLMPPPVGPIIEEIED